MDVIACHVCSLPSVPAGSVRGAFSGKDFELRQCDFCGFAFVANPLGDLSKIYDQAYYEGRGADPLVDYMGEVTNSDSTVRRYEWSGIARAVGSLVPVTPETRWLDIGSGLGGFVGWLREHGVGAVGAEEGWAAEYARGRGVPMIQLDEHEGQFDVITCIEVIEHVRDPKSFFAQVARLLRPGGLLWLTTGNSSKWIKRGELAKWNYVIPEIHISFFEPRTTARVMRNAGLLPAVPRWLPGYEGIMRFKILKNIGGAGASVANLLLPWAPTARLANLTHGSLQHPWAFKPLQ